MRRNRNETEMIAEILSCCESGCRVTTIIREANIPHTRLQPVLERLIAGGLVSAETHSEPVYTITKQGASFLAEYRRFQNLCSMYALVS